MVTNRLLPGGAENGDPFFEVSETIFQQTLSHTDHSAQTVAYQTVPCHGVVLAIMPLWSNSMNGPFVSGVGGVCNWRCGMSHRPKRAGLSTTCRHFLSILNRTRVCSDTKKVSELSCAIYAKVFRSEVESVSVRHAKNQSLSLSEGFTIT